MNENHAEPESILRLPETPAHRMEMKRRRALELLGDHWVLSDKRRGELTREAHQAQVRSGR